MANFDFHNLLVPSEFERLCRDILEVRDSPLKFRTFGPWKDEGVDLLCTTQKDIIGQCKLYNPNNYNALKSSLKKELAKCKRKNPERYILCISLELNVNQLEEVFNLFEGHIKTLEDILDRNRLCQYLEKPEYKYLLKNYSKLLIPNLTLLETILGNILNRKHITKTQSFLKDIVKHHKLYHNTKITRDCIDILEKNRVLILTGNPGVGKTTTAKMVSNYFISRNIKNVLFLSGDTFGEVEGLLSDDQPQLIVIDDFWGQNFSPEYKLNVRLNDFNRIINDIKNSSNCYLILTSREYILKDVLNIAEFDTKIILKTDAFTINLNDFSEEDKTRIFLNHLLYYDFGKEYITYLKYNNTLERIINHPNYSPRHIEFFIKSRQLAEVSNSHLFYHDFYNYLKKPNEYWNKNFNNLNGTSQLILLILLISSDPIDLHDLEKSFNAVQELARNTLNKNIYPLEFRNELRLLENYYLISEKNEYNDEVLISFQSPGIKDYLLEYLRSEGYSWIKPLIEKAIFFNQLNFIFGTAEDEIHDFDSDIVLYGKKIVLHEELQTTLKEKLLKEFHSLNFSAPEGKALTGEFTNCNTSEETKYWKLTLLNNLFGIEEAKNIDVKNFIITEVQKDIDNYQSSGGKIASHRSMTEMPRVIKSINQYVQIDAKKLIQDYHSSITFTDEYDSFYNFKELFPSEFESFLKKNTSNIRKSIKDVIIDDIDHYLYEDEDVELDGLIHYTIERVFKQYNLRLTPKFVKEMEGIAGRSFRHLTNKKTIKRKTKIKRQHPPIKEKPKSSPLLNIVNDYLPQESHREFNAIQFLKNYCLDKNLINVIENELNNSDSVTSSFRGNQFIFSAYIDFICNNSIDIRTVNSFIILDSFFDYHCVSKNVSSTILKEIFYELTIYSFDNDHSITKSQLNKLLGKYGDSSLTIEALYPILIPDKNWFTLSNDDLKIYFIVEYLKTLKSDDEFKEETIENSSHWNEPDLLNLLNSTCPQQLKNIVLIPELKRFISLIDETSNRSIVQSFIDFFAPEFDFELIRKRKQLEESSSGNSETFIELALQYLGVDFSAMNLDIYFLKEYYFGDNIPKYFINRSVYSLLYERVINTCKTWTGTSFMTQTQKTYASINLPEFVRDDTNYEILSLIGMEDYILKVYSDAKNILEKLNSDSTISCSNNHN